MNVIGRTLILFGLALIAVGLYLIFGPKIPWLGRLPGDIVIKKENFSLYFPITTCILISVVISVILFLFSKK